MVLLEDLRGTINTLNQLVTFLTEERRAGDQTIKDILLTNHPMFDDLRGKIEVPYRVFFTNKEELTALLNSRRYKRIDSDHWDAETRHSHEEWSNDQNQPIRILKIAFEIFDESDKLRIFTPDEWKDEWVISYDIGTDGESDNLPF